MEPITVYDGWRLIRLEKRMDIPEAARLLCGRGRRRWANAVIEGEEAVLTGHAIRCPACGRDTPAYGDQGGSGVNKPRVLRWAARQASLFAQQERELVLSEVALQEGYWVEQPGMRELLRPMEQEGFLADHPSESRWRMR